MITRKVLVVFVLPVIFSVIFGYVVMYDILQKPDRELNMWSISFSEGFSNNYDQESIVLPVGYEFSKVIDISGSYEIVAEMVSKKLMNI